MKHPRRARPKSLCDSALYLFVSTLDFVDIPAFARFRGDDK